MTLASLTMGQLLASGMGSAQKVEVLLFVLLLVGWLVSHLAGVLTWLISLSQPLGWRWGLRRFLAGTIAVTTGVWIAWETIGSDLGRDNTRLGLASLTLAALLAVPTLGRRAPDTDEGSGD